PDYAADQILRVCLHARTAVGALDATQFALALLTSLDAVTGTITGAAAPAHYFTYRHLAKVGGVLKRFAMKDEDIAWLFNHGPLAFDSLPVVQTTMPGAFAKWSRLVAAAGLRKDFADGKLFDLFEGAALGQGTLTAALAEIASRTGWDVADVTSLATGVSPPLSYPTDFADERGLLRIKQGIDLGKRLSLPAEKFVAWKD